ncbi:predicted protein [Postia placenta Mad-698-R]|nr:predicted protein [Postia placenta Mad-698-R]
MSDTIAIASPADFHVHLRQGDLAALVTKHVRQGGFRLAYVMPNLKPPIANAEEALLYKAQLQAIDPTIEYLMTLYLSPDLTPDEIRKAKRAGIGSNRILVVLPQILTVASSLTRRTIRFECVKSLGDTVACTITAHHLVLTVDDWAGQSWNFCKPVAKFPDDRQALRDVIKEGHPRFFLGSDSAPHPPHTKSTATPVHACAAGVYTSPILLPLVAQVLESFGALDRLEGFVSTNGRIFYRASASAGENVVIRKVQGKRVEEKWVEGEQSVVPFWAGRDLSWEVVE